MATSTFYNDNLFRNYPLIASPASAAFPAKRLVGAKVLCSFGSPYKHFPSISLVEWTVRASLHRLVFRCWTDDTVVTVPVTIPADTGLFTHIFSDVVEATSLRITVGDLTRETQSFRDLDLPLEPTCVLWLKHRGIRSIRIGNASRERLAINSGIPVPQQTAYRQADWWHQETVITDSPLLLAEGYNASLIASTIDNSIRFQPQVGAGRGVVSEIVSLGVTRINGQTVPEIPDPSAFRPDGLPHQVVRSFSGLPGPEITAVTGQTILVRNDINPSTVSIGIRERECE